MSSTGKQTGEPVTTDKEYVDIIKSNITIDRKFVDETGIPAKIVYFCKDCQKLIVPKRIGKKLRFKCDECKGENVAFGTEKSIQSYFDVKPKEA